jgi:RimJ/RimL family protein N-acetyltransferase
MSEMSPAFPRPLPERRVLEGRHARIEPLAAVHADTLFAASSGDAAQELFRFMLAYAPADRAAFDAWLASVVASSDPLVFGVIDRASGRCEGRLSLMRITPEHGVVEIGGILWGPAIARTRVATDAFFLIAQYVFESLRYRRLEWKCNVRNEASRRAALRFGFQFEGVFRQHMMLKGENRDTAWYGMVDGDWPQVGAALRAWLAPDNFDAAGSQRARLQHLRAAVSADRPSV